MTKVGKFEKVSWLQFLKDIDDTFGCDKFTPEEVIQMHDNLKLPLRATRDSAGYDFYAPFSFTLAPNESIKIPTGIRARIDNGWFLSCYPRSGLGFKYCSTLANTVGIIDSLYYESDNEGHIFCRMINRSPDGKTMTVEKGAGFMQGIFIPFGITTDDNATGIRNGGCGSTDKK